MRLTIADYYYLIRMPAFYILPCKNRAFSTSILIRNIRAQRFSQKQYLEQSPSKNAR